MSPDEIKKTAITMVRERGLINLSRRDLCQRTGLADGSFPRVMRCTFTEFVEQLQLEGHGDAIYPVSKSRANPALRRANILAVAVAQSRTRSFSQLTRNIIAEAAGVSPGLVTRYFPTMAGLRNDIMREAIRASIPEIVAQGLAVGNARAKKAPPELRKLAAQFIEGV